MPKIFFLAFFYVIVNFQNLGADAISNMHDLEQAVGIMQKGFLYDDRHLLKEGSRMLIESYETFKAEDMIDYINSKSDMQQRVALDILEHEIQRTRKLKNIIEKEDDNKPIDDMDKFGMHDIFIQTLNSCTKCHALIRAPRSNK